MANQHRIGIIGAGNMGGAIVRGMIAAKIAAPSEIIVAEIDSRKRVEMAKLGCAVTVNAAEAACTETILLAVKPQLFPEMAKQIAPLPEAMIVISIMAGLNTALIRAALGGEARIIRAMPNVACQIGAGMTAIALGAGAKAGDEKFALRIFDALGRTVVVEESLMHAVTAVSGSGPAYVFLLAEAMERAAMELGFDAPAARLLVSQTVLGAGKLLCESNRSPIELKQSVTSPGGTTAAALSVFDSRQLEQIVIDALTAARDRGRELDQSPIKNPGEQR